MKPLLGPGQVVISAGCLERLGAQHPWAGLAVVLGGAVWGHPCSLTALWGWNLRGWAGDPHLLGGLGVRPGEAGAVTFFLDNWRPRSLCPNRSHMFQKPFSNFKVFDSRFKKKSVLIFVETCGHSGLGSLPGALLWLDWATTLRKGVSVRELYPLIPPTLPRY